eukprot:GHVL01014638.1.p1 GENE.GHVL01014638.1~~GHVL01014638.1.p1  ORF type:complete len:180 (-),score=18.04 GHVL01014638.1:193-732(-)
MDIKRGDIGTTAEAYAKAFFHTFDADAVTVSPYMGHDSVFPFSSYSTRGVFVLCKTSNPGANDLQLFKNNNGTSLYVHVARLCQEQWSLPNKNVALVVGATDPVSIKAAREAAPDLWILAPGVGAQGGDLEKAVMAGVSDVVSYLYITLGLRKDGLGMLIPVSRGISRAEVCICYQLFE